MYPQLFNDDKYYMNVANGFISFTTDPGFDFIGGEGEVIFYYYSDSNKVIQSIVTETREIVA